MQNRNFPNRKRPSHSLPSTEKNTPRESIAGEFCISWHFLRLGFWKGLGFTMRPEMMKQIIQKQLFYVTDVCVKLDNQFPEIPGPDGHSLKASCGSTQNRKNPRAHKNKIGTSTPPPKKPKIPPPKKEEFYGHGGFPAERTKKMPGAHKIGAAISGPRIAGGNFMDITLFLTKYTREFLPDSPV